MILVIGRSWLSNCSGENGDASYDIQPNRAPVIATGTAQPVAMWFLNPGCFGGSYVVSSWVWVLLKVSGQRCML